MVEIKQYFLAPTDLIPNSPRPLLHYKNVLPRTTENPDHCSAARVYHIFESNGWKVEWLVRYGQTQLSHFHSKAHEVMAVLSGHATIRFGVADTSEDMHDNTYGSAREEGGIELKAEAGDIFLIPAGVAHKTYDTKPESELKLLTPGSGHGIDAKNPREALETIKLSGFTMMGAYNGGGWDFIKGGGEYEKIWSIPKPKCDPVLGDSEEGLNRFWRGSNMALRVHL
ncbi:hypothetical protein LCI18_003898 [Fusarium solani-melongenae]|uniref:Uncharacterized protein n=1 Tax=Fusarium solani subsp. cucurbitae TaxID=2747967 RepID=A0ACD3YVE3_FUSSC|nr:hypothetical protein LCI18_003898 [Fusarium solani-melongenae]